VILLADKEVAGRFFVYSMGRLWESTDGGENFILVRNGYFYSFDLDFYQCKLRKVPTRTNDLFWARGPINTYGASPAPGGLMFSSNKGADIVEISAFSEVEDIGFGRPKFGRTYPRLLVKGWIGGVVGYYYSDDFNPASPNSATWNLWTVAPMGRADDDSMIAGDMGKVGRFYVVTSAGGFQVLDRDYKIRAS
jgi:hypothetical protein